MDGLIGFVIGVFVGTGFAILALALCMAAHRGDGVARVFRGRIS